MNEVTPSGEQPHLARQHENLLAICEYILSNPVRKGLAKEVNDWPYVGMLDQLPI